MFCYYDIKNNKKTQLYAHYINLYDVKSYLCDVIVIIMTKNQLVIFENS